MPAKSKAQQQAMAIAEHTPSKLSAKNKGLKKMSKAQLHDYAATPTKGLPEEEINGLKLSIEKLERFVVENSNSLDELRRVAYLARKENDLVNKYILALDRPDCIDNARYEWQFVNIVNSGDKRELVFEGKTTQKFPVINTQQNGEINIKLNQVTDTKVIIVQEEKAQEAKQK